MDSATAESTTINTDELTKEQQSDSPPSKRAKRQSKDESATTSSDATITAVNLNGSNPESNQHSTNTDITDNQQPSKNSIYNFVFPSEDDSVGSPGENLGPNSAGLKSSQAGGVWNKSREEAHSAQVKEKSLLGHIIGLEGTQQRISESDLFRILESEGVTEIGALYKVSPSKFVLVFGSKAAREKLENTEIQSRLGDLDICLNFHKRMGPFRNGREPIFVTILLPEFISDQAVRLAFSEFGEVISVFKGRHKFNSDIRNGKRHVKIFPAGGDPGTLPRKISFYGRVRRDVLFAEKVVLCYRCKTRHMLGENCPVVTPTSEDSSMSLTEQSVAESSAPVQPESSDETQQSTESQQTSPPTQEEAEEEESSAEDESGSGSDSASTSESDDGDGAVPETGVGPGTPLGGASELSSREELSAGEGAQVNQDQDSQKLKAIKPKISPLKGDQNVKTENQSVKPKKALKSLKDFPYDVIYWSWYGREKEGYRNIFRETVADLGVKGDKAFLERLVTLLGEAAEIIRNPPKDDEMFDISIRCIRERHFQDTPIEQQPTIEAIDNYLYCWAVKVWPRALDKIHEYTRSKNDRLGFY